jgi:hypothetical protein
MLIQRRVDLEKRLLLLKQTIAGLSALCDQKEERRRSNGNSSAFPPFIKLTSATRQVLAEADFPMSPPSLRDALVQRGLNVKQYSNPLAVIHNTLLRLQRQGEAVQVSGAWTLTDKGRLASKMDQLDVSMSQPQGRASRKVRQ